MPAKCTPLNIKDPTAYSLAATLARITGKSMTRVVVDALREELSRRQTSSVDWSAVREILERVDALPRIQEARTDEEILGYDERGLFGGY